MGNATLEGLKEYGKPIGAKVYAALEAAGITSLEQARDTAPSIYLVELGFTTTLLWTLANYLNRADARPTWYDNARSLWQHQSDVSMRPGPRPRQFF